MSMMMMNGDDGNCIQHTVSKMDTLAGVAIKYGVEVADIKRMNGLVTDLQMFALKSLRVPLPGRHPPSPTLVNGSDTPGERSATQTRLGQVHADMLGLFPSARLGSPQPSVSPAMNSLQGYYGLKASNHKDVLQGTEMAVYRSCRAHYLEDGIPPKPSPVSDPPPSKHRKSRSLVNEEVTLVFPVTEERECDAGDSGCRTPEMLLKADNSGSSSFLPKTGQGLALRPKSASRTSLPGDTDSAGESSLVGNGLMRGVRKSSSTSNLQDQEKSDSASKRSLKPDFQARSAATIAKPMFDGLPKPVSSRRNKAAVD